MKQHLFIDADDTLWENNIYFEQAIHTFISYLNHSQLSPAEVRVVLNEIERLMGYGTTNFTNSLEATYRRLAEKEIQDEDIRQIRQFGEELRTHPLELLDGVKETLEYLSARHTLLLVTKGDQEEQRLKVERSGIEHHFSQVIIAQEKEVSTYQRLVNQLQVQLENTWMIGNSPRSDINPALAAGLNAVFIPHPHTWSLEHEEVQHLGNGKLLQLSRFSELQAHF